MSARPGPAARCGPADLLRLLAAGGEPLLKSGAALLYYREKPESPPAAPPEPVADAATVETPESPPQPSESPEPEVTAFPVGPARFWFVETCEPITPKAPEGTKPPAVAPPEPSRSPSALPVIHSLAPWPELRRRLKPLIAVHREGAEPDLPRLVDSLARGRRLDRLPRCRQPSLAPELWLILDRSERLVPYWSDQDRLAAELARLLPHGGLSPAVFHEGLAAPRPLDSAGSDWPLPPAGGTVLVLGDLGSLWSADQGEPWLCLGKRLRAAGCRPVALVPCRPERVPSALRRLWRVLCWEAPPPLALAAGEEAGENTRPRSDARRLLNLLAPAVRIEPGLLRAVRLCLADPALDAAVESEVWQSAGIASTHSDAATPHPKGAAERWLGFAAEDPAIRRRVLALLRTWRGGLPPEIWYEEVLNLPPEVRDALPEPADLDAARYFFAWLAGHLAEGPVATTPAGDWMRRVFGRARNGGGLWRDQAVGASLLRLDWALHRHRPGYLPAGDIDPEALPPGDLPPLRVGLYQRGAELCLVPAEPAAGSFLGYLETANRLVSVRPGEDADAFWETGTRPGWADDWGWDGYGAWVTFSVDAKDGACISQRLRWIEPGRFWMGSPENEPERYGDEGPQHEVTIRAGFWLFDTACTQALWEAAMEENPSRFQGPDRPVEQVSWDEARRFIERLNALKPGLDLSLPSEAQWEYACRAGTTTPFNFGENVTPEQVNYDGNSPYAGGAKGEYRQQTVPVKSLPPNAWGLYEMHGNVFEWVQDAWHDSYQGAPTDGSAWESDTAGADRVIRGGSWNVSARNCRSAFRVRHVPDVRLSHLGFRCARVQDRESGGPAGASGARVAGAARPAERGRPGRAGGVARSGRVPEGRLLRLDRAGRETVSLPDSESSRPLPEREGTKTLIVTTDRQRLTLRCSPKPRWARAMGRDRFGLWADIAVEPEAGGAPAIQRLRWIPPGRFRMGSPEDEPGRYDWEGPQQIITLTEGYWLFDTPCTQALWEAVLGDNPSHFKDPRRPVETVSWQDVQDRFLPELNRRFENFQTGDPGRFVLPSEAQWEYACRAGTETALYTGPIDILGDMNAPNLDPIAWYGGNSGHHYDLDEGEDSTTGWWEGKEKQYPHTRAGTWPVAQKLPNPWGLCDMLGNVWEWTEDAWHDSHEGAAPDGRPREGAAGADRVIRGGSWYGNARYCRSAYRYWFDPGFRGNGLGFRCARVQA